MVLAGGSLRSEVLERVAVCANSSPWLNPVSVCRESLAGTTRAASLFSVLEVVQVAGLPLLLLFEEFHGLFALQLLPRLCLLYFPFEIIFYCLLCPSELGVLLT